MNGKLSVITKSKPVPRGRGLPLRIREGKLTGGLESKLSGSRKFTSLAMISILLIIMWSPTIEAAETRVIDGWIRIDPDLGNMTVTESWNMSDPDTFDLFNWNQTVDPFEENNSLTGSFTGTFLPPIDYTVVEDHTKLTVCGLVKFKSTWIMSGSSESWWRVPVDGPGWGDSTNITIWHIDSPATLNVTDSGTPNNISHPSKVFDQDFNMNVASLNKTVRYWNGTAWDRGFNSTWLRVGAQIHTDEFYLVRFVIYNVNDPYRIRFSSTDQCEDRVSQSWMIYYEGTRVVYEADLDFSVLHIQGMGYSVWGQEINSEREVIYDMDFEDVDGTAADDYHDDITISVGGSTVAEIDDAQYHGGNTSMLMSYDGGTACQVDIDITDMGQYSRYEFWIRAEQTDTYLWMEWLESTVIMIQVVMSNAGQIQFKYGNGAGGTTPVNSPYSVDTWYQIWVDLDRSQDLYRGWVDGVKVPGPNANDQGFDNLYNDRVCTVIDVWHIGTSGNSGAFWKDDLMIYSDHKNKVTWYTELDHKIQQGEYLTVMIPFLDVVDNATNVLIGFGTQNDSWATAFWVAGNGPTDFGLKSVQWDVAWGSKDMKIEMTIYNRSRSIWIMDSNPEFDPDWTWELDRYTVNDHVWAPSDYYFGGTPYHSCQVTNGSWENTQPTGNYYLSGRLVDDPDQLMKKRQDGDNWLVEIWLDGYVGVARVTAAFSYALQGDFDKAWDILDPSTPFPLDAPWYLGKYYFKGLAFLTNLAGKIWVGLVWLYEAGQWIADNASWIAAGVFTLLVLISVPYIWNRFFKAIWGLIKFGWILAQDGLVAASEHADTFWKEFVSGSVVLKVAKRVKNRGGG